MKRLLSILLATISVCSGVPVGGVEKGFAAGAYGLENVGQQVLQWSESASHKVVPHYGSYGRERAVLESEPLLSKLDTLYTKSHQLIANLIGHKATIDTLQEHEKYGNDGHKSRELGKAFIAGFDGIANIVNGVLDKPDDFQRYASKQATSILNVVGAHLVGL